MQKLCIGILPDFVLLDLTLFSEKRSTVMLQAASAGPETHGILNKQLSGLHIDVAVVQASEERAMSNGHASTSNAYDHWSGAFTHPYQVCNCQFYSQAERVALDDCLML